MSRRAEFQGCSLLSECNVWYSSEGKLNLPAVPEECVFILTGNESDTDASDWNRRGCSRCWIVGKLHPRRCSVEGIKYGTEMKTVLQVTTQFDV